MVKIIDWSNFQKKTKQKKTTTHTFDESSWTLAKLLLNLPEFQVYLKLEPGESQILLLMFHKVLQIKHDLRNK